MAKAHMTKEYWFDTELDNAIRQGYAQGEAMQIVLDKFATMDSIEWYEPDNNNLTVLSDNGEEL